ncbi:cadherin-related family member 5 [Mugil cephalus]|uniref:cadherin-related family member 5 n=1 Tax=Mugil cephalus TaxID=48193 RepID=UPI001FB711A0|nr:cadherin-related family member 5 [Mugil cephalus]
MALTELNPRAFVCSLFVLSCLHTATGMSGWAGCLDGEDVFAKVKENSLAGEVVAELMADTSMEGVQWSLRGKDADWFFLDERNIRLNASADKVFDREVLGPVLMAELSCHEEDTLQSVYRVVVEILNENDNLPTIADNKLVQSLTVSELIPVNSVVFTVQATDGDNDKLVYSVDPTSPDAEYFKVDLPNSGEVILAKPLDYETKNLLTVTVYASEMNTAEHFNTSTNITITVRDGDDQYPQFLPCVLLFQDETSRICTSPKYTVNVTEGEEDIVLDFTPGPIHAVDGDRGLNSTVSYAILSGDDDERFIMDKQTGEVRLIRGVRDRLTAPELYLQVMAYQDNDPRKYSVATVLVRVLAVNLFHPEFDKPEYHGFVTAEQSAASLVNTYGSKALMLHVLDQDFNQGFNPMIGFTFSPTSNHTDIYQVTREGLLIARNSRLKPKQKHVLEVMALDQESGDATFATVVVEVLPEGQLIPYSPLEGDRLTGCAVGKALFLSMVFMTVLGCILSVVLWLKKKHKGKRDPLERGCVAQGKHPNVSLRWFTVVSHRSAMPHMEEVPYKNEEYGTCNPSFSFADKSGICVLQDLPSCPEPISTQNTAVHDTSFVLTETVCSSLVSSNNNNASTPNKSPSSSPTCYPSTVDVGPPNIAEDAALCPENTTTTTPAATTPEPIDARSNTSPDPGTHDSRRTPPSTRPDSQTTTNDDPTDLVTSPSSQSSVPCSQTRIASAEIDKPFCKPRARTPPYSPVTSSPLPKQTSTPPPTPENAPLKATLVHIDTSPLDTPPESPEPTSVSADEPSTSLDQIDQSGDTGVTADTGSPSQDRRPSTNSGNTQDGRGLGDEEDDGFLGDEDADKNSEGDSELDPDDEELLRAIARCNPIFITFGK